MRNTFRAEDGAFFDLSDRVKLRITGGDRLRYLNGQITNDLRKATDNSAIRACVLNAKGRINADVFVISDGESFIIDAEAETREQLVTRLERYVIADNVRIEDVTEEFALLHLLGGKLSSVPARARLVQAERFGFPGTDLWLSRSEREPALQTLAARFSFCDETCAETLRIERGIPRLGRELTEEIIPTEANLETTAIDYAKGCYIGQEVISRIKMSGQTNKRLCGFVSTEEKPLTAGMRLITITDDAKDVGWITSVTESARLAKWIALGFVKRGHQDLGTRFQARPAEASPTAPTFVEIVRLPFW